MIALFSSEPDAIAFDAAVSTAMGWPDAETKTERYAIPLKHPTANVWAMPVEEYAAAYLPDGVEIVAELSPDWLPPMA